MRPGAVDVADHLVEGLGAGKRRRCRGLGPDRRLDVLAGDAAVRAGAGDGGEVETGLRGEPAGKRRDQDAVGPGRPEVPHRRLHFTEQVEVAARRGRARGAVGAAAARPPHCAGAGAAAALRCGRLRHGAPVGDDRQHGADRRDGAFADIDRAEHARGDGRHLDRHLVGLDLAEIVARRDLVADLP